MWKPSRLFQPALALTFTVIEMTISVVELNSEGTFCRLVPTTAQTLAESAVLEPENGVYLVSRTWNGGGVLDLDAHFDRLERSAAAQGRTLSVPRRAIRRVIYDHLPVRAGLRRDGRFRVTAVLDAVSRYVVSVEEARGVPPDALQSGVVCRIVSGAARSDPTVKSTGWIHERRRLGSDPDVYEWLLSDRKGYILEGATSNFYAVCRGELYTASEGVLEGIARRIVLAVAPGILPVRMHPVGVNDLSRVEEAFISSATRGVVPVRRISGIGVCEEDPGAVGIGSEGIGDEGGVRAASGDLGERLVGDRGEARDLGEPGVITRRIMAAYDRYLQAHLQPLLPE